MKCLIFIIKIIFKIKITFKEPDNYDLVIFDDVAIDELEAILKNRKYFILQSRVGRIDKIYISLKMTLKYFKWYLPIEPAPTKSTFPPRAIILV